MYVLPFDLWEGTNVTYWEGVCKKGLEKPRDPQKQLGGSFTYYLMLYGGV
jgi:hypothetical protein